MSDSGEEGPEITRAFWAIELVPGKEYKTVIPLDLNLTAAVLPASAKDTSRSVVSITFADEPDKTFAIASLKLDSSDSQNIDVKLDEDSEVTFTVSGKNPVHLSGYYVPSEEGPEGFYDEDDEDIDSDEVGEFGEGSDSEDEEIDPAVLAMIAKKRKALENGADASKKPKTEAPQQQPKKENKAAPAKPQQQEAKKPQQQQQQKGQQQKVVQFPNGLKYTVTQEGSGAEARKGKKVGVKYVGKLTKNGKVFDASKNKAFSFNLGAREVITGWDLGVVGMKVGEKRTLVIPPDLGYGARGAGRDIPPNSSLTFDVELVYVS